MKKPFSLKLLRSSFFKAFVLYFFAIMFLLSCGKDNDDRMVNPLNGDWSHESHSCGFSQTTQLENESYTWSLNTTEGKLTVESSYSGDFFCILSPGTYDIIVEGDKIIIEPISYDYSISEKKLTVSNDPASDGPQFTFVRDK